MMHDKRAAESEQICSEVDDALIGNQFVRNTISREKTDDRNKLTCLWLTNNDVILFAHRLTTRDQQ